MPDAVGNAWVGQNGYRWMQPDAVGTTLDSAYLAHPSSWNAQETIRAMDAAAARGDLVGIHRILMSPDMSIRKSRCQPLLRELSKGNRIHPIQGQQ